MRRGHSASRHVGMDQRRCRAPISESDLAPTRARSSGACAVSVAIAKRERKARRRRAYSNTITAAAAHSPRFPARHPTLASIPATPRQLVASSGRGVPAGEIKRRPAFARQHKRRAGTPDAKHATPPLRGRAIRRKVRRAPNDLERGQHGETEELRPEDRRGWTLLYGACRESLAIAFAESARIPTRIARIGRVA